ncbi:MAG: hypothetical protein MJE77_04130 [Proteobacteria bacterium]|nr:hypothetical protein [Pseudomonadota bacterium]
MKKLICRLTTLAVFVLVGALPIINCSTVGKKPITKPAANAWSEPVKGLSGRVRVAFEDLNPGLRHAVHVELKNHTLNPVAVISHPRIQPELFDSAGKPVSVSGFSMSGPSPIPQWAVIPRDAYIGLRVDMQTVGVPTRKHGMAVLAVGGKAWQLGAGAYVLEIALAFKKQEDAPPNQWVGELALPPVDIVVTMQMLAER